MPCEVVPVMLNPLIVTQLLAERRKPYTGPLIVTLAPAAGMNTMGSADEPEFFTVTWSGEVPVETITVVPAIALVPAAAIVHSGWVTVPGPTFEQPGLFRST